MRSQPFTKSVLTYLTTLFYFILFTSVLCGQSAFEGKRVLIVLKDTGQLQPTRLVIESNGGHVVHIYPPRILQAYLTEKSKLALNLSGIITLIAEEPIDPGTLKDMSTAEEMGVSNWNKLFITTVKPHEIAIKINPGEIPRRPTKTAANNKSAILNSKNLNTSDYLIGSVSVGIIIVESNGTTDPKTETWTPNDMEHITEQIYGAMEWWSQAGGYRANLSWTYDIKRCTTGYEPITRSREESSVWVKDCMNQLGYTEGEDYERTRAYSEVLRKQYKTDWSFLIFVVPAQNDDDGYFGNKSGVAWAYVGGPYMVIPNKCNGWGYNQIWKVIAHETGHVFNATDEYENRVTQHTASILDMAGLQNPGKQIQDACMMKSNDLFLCDRTRAQIGWVDLDHDGVFDSDVRHVSSVYHREKMVTESELPTTPKLMFYENFVGHNEWFEDHNNYMKNGAYIMYDSVYGSSSWLDKDYYDFTASVRTLWLQGSAASGYGLMVRVKTATDGYIFFINKHRQYAFGKYVNSNWKYLAPWDFSEAINSEGVNILTAKCTGNRFTLYINDQQITEVTDDTFIYGNIGLAVLPEVKIAFDDLTIFKP
ncbi:hypothetical protein JNL27_02860 [bacterium]|nr:hypothetical protein [bacterium]